MENPYMFTGKVERVRIRIDADQFTQIVDQFSDRFKVVGYDADESKYYDIELKVISIVLLLDIAIQRMCRGS